MKLEFQITDSKEEVKDEDMRKKDALEKDKIKYYGDQQNNAKPGHISIRDKDIVRKQQKYNALPYLIMIQSLILLIVKKVI